MIRIPLYALLALPLFACSGKDSGDDTGGDTDTDTNTDGCDTTIESTIPTAGAADAYYRANIEFELSEPDATAQITTSIPGTQTVSADGLRVIWTLSEPLAPSTAYSATLDYCGGSATIDFTTSSLGTPVSDPAGLVGAPYEVALNEARIVEPPGLGSVLSSYLTEVILIGVTNVSSDSINMIGAIAGDDGNQDYCDPTIPFPTADFIGSSYFSVGPQDTTFSVAGYDIDIEDLVLNGTFAADGSYFDGGVLSGTIDTRPLAPLLGEDEGAICELAVNFGAACEPCPSDGQEFCLTLVADQIYAERSSAAQLVEVLGEGCPGCESGPPDPSTCPA